MAQEGPEGDSYRAAFEEAQEEAIEALEVEARRRAMVGVKRRKVFTHQGEVIHIEEEQHYSDTLLIFLLNALRPEKYRRNVGMEISGKNGGPIQIDANLDAQILGLLAELQSGTEAATLEAPQAEGRA